MKTIFKKIITSILRIESRLVLLRYKPKVVAITGSVGKTSTKDAVYAVFSNVAYVRRSAKSYNSEIGLPLTILGCPNGWNSPKKWLRNVLKGLWLVLWPHKYPAWLILEVGVGRQNDMRVTASWLKTDAVIITAIGETPAHIEFFESRKHLVEEKSKLIKTLKKGGLLLLNADDEDVLKMKSKTKGQVITFGFNEGADILASEESISYGPSGEPEGVVFRVDEGGKSLPVVIDGVFGRNHVYASLAALALSSGLKLNILEAINSLKNYDISPGRMRLLKGTKDTFIIDDTYNSSPFAASAALKTLKEVNSERRKVAVLGDMLELGKHTIEAHKEIGRIASESVDILITVGQRAKAIKEGALEAGMDKDSIAEFLDSRAAGEYLKDVIAEKDFILIKGSQGMRMERTVEKILLDIENKKKLLVRQDKEWLEKE